MQFIEFPKMDIKVEGMENIRIPKMVRVRQHFDEQRIGDIPAWIRQQMAEKIKDPADLAGKRICITAGSRGIPHLDVIIRTVIEVLKSWGAQPFIIPAMGSHGGGTAEGQREVIEGFGITEEAMGVPILSSMEVVQIGSLPDGTPVCCDKNAMASDGIVVLNKVKPHTDFRGKHESGLAKMMAIGLAKHAGASQFHMKGFPSFAERIPQVCEVFLKHAPVAMGVGIVENAFGEICDIGVCEKEDILDMDARLLEEAKARMAKFRLPGIDVLVIDEIGKNISGNGHDPNITGRSVSTDLPVDCRIQKIFIRGLNEGTHHNGCGISAADITTRRALNSVDWQMTWVNVVTSTYTRGGQIPLYTETDRQAVLLAIRTCVGPQFRFEDVRLVHIRDTKHMDEIEVSENYLDVIEGDPDIEILSGPFELEFDEEGFLKSNLMQ